MSLKLLTEHHLEFLCLKAAAQARLSLHKSIYHIVGNHMSRLIYGILDMFVYFQGFAFINFHRREDAARAIAGVSGFGYDHLILNVEWAK